MSEKQLRGIMIDISRGQVPRIKTLKRMIDIASRSDLNFLSLYIEHTFQFKDHPIIWKATGAMSSSDIKHLIAYAKRKGIEIIPSIQAMGHFENILKHKEYACLSESSLYYSLAPALKGSYRLLEDMIRDITDVFQSEYINIGCDEIWDIAKGKSRRLASEKGGPQSLFVEHIKRIYKIVKQYNKKCMMWGDMLFNLGKYAKQIPPDMIILNWYYEDAGIKEFTKRLSFFQKIKMTQMICPGASTWTTLFPLVAKAAVNVSNFTKAGQAFNNIKGFMITTWGDRGNFNFLGEALPAFLFFARCINTKEKKINHDQLYRDLWQWKTGTKLFSMFCFFSGLWQKLEFKSFYDMFTACWNRGVMKHTVDRLERKKDHIRSILGQAVMFRKGMKGIRPGRFKIFFREIVYKMSFCIHFLEKILFFIEARENYGTAYQNLPDSRVVLPRLKSIREAFKKLYRSEKHLRKKFAGLWKKSYRRPGLKVNVDRFLAWERYLKSKAAQTSKLISGYRKKGGTLPKPVTFLDF
ncbi:MAG: family 20 glycosylhydrolase [Spirochaetes bacterium]|nr:family 20 glycosylhydrolase [Spirochaetota bacterium]